MKYTIKNNGQSNEKILNKDGIQTTCPFPQPFPMPAQDGKGMVIMRLPCTTQCPHATFDEESMKWYITCGIGASFDIAEIEQPQPEPEREPSKEEQAKVVRI